MKIAAVIILVIALLAGATAWYLHATASGGLTGVRFPISGRQRALLEVIPEDAEAFALIPAAAALHAELLANPVTRDAVAKWSAANELPRSWMLGGADVVVWRTKNQTGYAFRLDRFRASLIHLYSRAGGGGSVRASGGTFVINRSEVPPISGARIDEALQLSSGLPPGDLLVVQLERARGAFPPIARPAATSVELSSREILLTSRALRPVLDGDRPAQRSLLLAEGAILSASFRTAPRLLGDLDRLLGSKVSSLLGDGGSIALYDVDTGTLLPRPRGVIAIPEGRGGSAEGIRTIVETFGAMEVRNGEVLIALDRESLPKYVAEARVASPWPDHEWAIRADPRRLVPLLEELGDNTALRIAAPRVYRSARDLRKWIRSLEGASSIEAALVHPPGAEELRVRVASK